MKNIIFIFVLFMTPLCWSHPEGHGPQRAVRCKSTDACSEDEIKEGALNVFNFLLQTTQIGPSWEKVKSMKDLKMMSFADQKAWVASFENQIEADEKRKVLYIVLSPTGLLLGMTYDKNQIAELSTFSKVIGIGLIFGISFLFYFLFLRKKADSNPTGNIS